MIPIATGRGKPLWERLRDLDERHAFHRRHARPPERVPHVGTLQEQLAKAYGLRRPDPMTDAEVLRLLVGLRDRPAAQLALLLMLREAEGRAQ